MSGSRTRAPQERSDRVPSIWVNGKRVEDGHVSALDRGFMLADGVFETMRARRAVIFRRAEHLERLALGLSILDIPAVPAVMGWLDEAAAALDGDTALRLTVTRGVGAFGLLPGSPANPTVVITANPLPVFPTGIYEQGLIAHVASGRRDGRSRTAGIKTLAYTEAIAALVDAKASGAHEALFLDVDGHCSEASASNLFVWTGSALLTPPLSCGALAGVTRGAVLELAAALEIPATEQPFDLEVLAAADEAFLTSSLRGLAPLVRVDDRPIGSGSPGAVTRRLRAAYDALVDRECPP